MSDVVSSVVNFQYLDNPNVLNKYHDRDVYPGFNAAKALKKLAGKQEKLWRKHGIENSKQQLQNAQGLFDLHGYMRSSKEVHT